MLNPITLNVHVQASKPHKVCICKTSSIAALKEMICKDLNLDEEQYEMVDFFQQTQREVLSDPNQIVQEAMLVNNQDLLMRDKRQPMTPLEEQATTSAPADDASTAEPLSTSTAIVIHAGPPPRPRTNAKPPSSSTFNSSKFRLGGMDDTVVEAPNRLPGLVGLSNLGNTCYMNSSLQCLLHTVPFMKFFLTGQYRKDINRVNPLGQKGELAEAFASLMANLWRPDVQQVRPYGFKAKISRFCPVFTGYGQQDSQELLAFLLDGLHEDLNRIKDKPYIEESKEVESLPDDQLAAHQWALHRARNDSMVVDHCLGMYRSTLVCPKCGHTSRKFDPVMYLSLPLPESRRRSLEVVIIHVDGSQPPKAYQVEVPSVGTVKDLLYVLARVAGMEVAAPSVAHSRVTSVAAMDKLAGAGATAAPESTAPVPAAEQQVQQQQPSEESVDPACGLPQPAPLSLALPHELLLLAKVTQPSYSGSEQVAVISNPKTRVAEVAPVERGNTSEFLVAYRYPSVEQGPSNQALHQVVVHHRRKRPGMHNSKHFAAPLVLLLPDAGSGDGVVRPEELREVGTTYSMEYEVSGTSQVVAGIRQALLPFRTAAGLAAEQEQQDGKGQENGQEAGRGNMGESNGLGEREPSLPRSQQAGAGAASDGGVTRANGDAAADGLEGVDGAGAYTDMFDPCLPIDGPDDMSAAATREGMEEMDGSATAVERVRSGGDGAAAGSKAAVRSGSEGADVGQAGGNGGSEGGASNAAETAAAAAGPHAAGASRTATGEHNMGAGMDWEAGGESSSAALANGPIAAAVAAATSPLATRSRRASWNGSSAGAAPGLPAVQPFDMWAAQAAAQAAEAAAEPSGAPHAAPVKCSPPVRTPPFVVLACRPDNSNTTFYMCNPAEALGTNAFVVEWPSSPAHALYDTAAMDQAEQHESVVRARQQATQGRKPVTLSACFEAFLQPEELSEDDTWYCSRCKDHVQADKKLDLWHLPEVLVVHLKRFCYTRTHRQKLDTQVDFPLEGLDLSRFLTRQQEGVTPLYDLYAVSNHFGSMGGGHYTAFCKMPDSQRWYCFDDSSVTPAEESDVVSSAAYVLMYRRRTEAAADPPDLVQQLMEARAQQEAACMASGHDQPADQDPDQDQDSLPDLVEGGHGATGSMRALEPPPTESGATQRALGLHASAVGEDDGQVGSMFAPSAALQRQLGQQGGMVLGLDDDDLYGGGGSGNDATPLLESVWAGERGGPDAGLAGDSMEDLSGGFLPDDGMDSTRVAPNSPVMSIPDDVIRGGGYNSDCEAADIELDGGDSTGNPDRSLQLMSTSPS